MNVYVAGSISRLIRDGYTPAQIRMRFHEAGRKVWKLGHAPILPPDMVLFEKPWTECMRADLKVLVDCGGIYLMRGWQKSKGARLERQIAQALGMEILYE